MLKRRLRLRRSTFPAQGRGARLQSPHFSILYGPAKVSGGCSAVVSKKVAKKSVDRHLLKRRMLDVMGAYYSPEYFVVAYARGGSEKLKFTLLKEELSQLLMKMKGSVAQ